MKSSSLEEIKIMKDVRNLFRLKKNRWCRNSLPIDK